jgi:hypothetical protein
LTGDKKTITARYWNCNYFATAIVAVITEGINWAAYIGGADYHLSEEAAVEWVAQTGEKLSKSDAKHFFPDITLPYRL